MTASPTASWTASSQRTPSEIPSVSPHCQPEFFSWLPHFTLDGDVLGMDAAAVGAAGCRVACCHAAGCTAFGLQILPANVPGTCVLFTNVTQLVPSTGWGAGVLLAALPTDVAL